MPIRELYYTSFNSPQANKTGFQVKASSPGISRADMNALNKAMGYAIPPSLPNDDIAQHPVALRYLPIDASRAALVCNQSVGPDENGRPGNYFAHVVLGEMVLISRQNLIPPIMYWKSSYWLTKHESIETQLPLHNDWKAPIAFNHNAMWELLGSTVQHPKAYRAMLSCLVNSDKPIIIRDQIENVALWIYALSLPLPPRLRNLLSFSTYDHNPLQSAFRVVGVPPDTALPPGDYFLLDGIQMIFGEAPSSVFADFVADHFSEAQLEETLLELNNWLQYRVRHAESIPRHLDALTDFYLVHDRGELGRTWPQMVNATAAVVETLPQTQLESQDIEAAEQAWSLMGRALHQQPKAEWVPIYQRAFDAYKNHAPDPTAIYASLALHLAQAISSTHPDITRQLEWMLKQDEHSKATENPAALAAVRLDRIEQAQLFWGHYAPHLSYAESTHHHIAPLLRATFHLLDAQSTDDLLSVPAIAAEVIKRMVAAVREHRAFVLHEAALYQHENPEGHAFHWVYYALIQRLSLQQRAEHYWTRYWNQVDGLYQYELRRDLGAFRSTDDIVDHLLQWLNVLDEEWRTIILHYALEMLQGGVEPERFAQRMLAEEIVTGTLSAEWYARLLEIGLMHVTIDYPSANTVVMYEKFAREVPLSPYHAAVIEGSLALHQGTLSRQAVENLNTRFRQLEDVSIYEHEVLALFGTFFTTNHHEDLIQAAYVPKFRAKFWDIYWARFAEWLSQGDVNRIGGILDFWFSRAENLYQQTPHVVPEFFIQLRDTLVNLSNDRAIKPHMAALDQICSRLGWYPFLEPIFKKSGRKGLFGGLMGN